MTERTSTVHARRSLFLAIIGAGLVVLFVRRVGPRVVLTQLLRVGPRALWLLLPYAVGTTIGAIPWRSLLPEASRPRFAALVAGRFAASGANALLPFFGLAGEPSRLLWLSSGSRAEGLAAIVVDRVLYNSASALLLLCGAVAAGMTSAIPPSVAVAAVGLSGVILAVTLAICWAAARYGIGRRTQALLRRTLGTSYATGHFGDEVDAALLRILRGSRGPFASGIVLHFLGRAVIASEVYFGLWMLDARVGFVPAFVLAVVPIGLSFFVSSIPSQLGVQEGAQAAVAAALGLNPATGLALVLLQRFRQLAYVPLAPLLIGAAPSRAIAQLSGRERT